MSLQSSVHEVGIDGERLAPGGSRLRVRRSVIGPEARGAGSRRGLTGRRPGLGSNSGGMSQGRERLYEGAGTLREVALEGAQRSAVRELEWEVERFARVTGPEGIEDPADFRLALSKLGVGDRLG